jgi:hypothetical protein
MWPSQDRTDQNVVTVLSRPRSKVAEKTRRARRKTIRRLPMTRASEAASTSLERVEVDKRLAVSRSTETDFPVQEEYVEALIQAHVLMWLDLHRLATEVMVPAAEATSAQQRRAA